MPCMYISETSSSLSNFFKHIAVGPCLSYLMIPNLFVSVFVSTDLNFVQVGQGLMIANDSYITLVVYFGGSLLFY